LQAKLRELSGTLVGPARFFTFADLEEDTRGQLQKVRAHPWIAKDIPVRGVVFEVETGRVKEVTVWPLA
jgi:carbonic anhydrase